MTKPFRSPALIGTIGALCLVGTLAGCSSAPASTASYKNGTYTATGTYQSPGGQEAISVTLTIADSTATAVKVTPVTTTDANAQAYQRQFIDGISAVVVGKKISDLNVSQVGGSSLTSNGFNAALSTIEADAR